MHDTRQPAPDYTNAALAMALVNLLWIFAVIWAVWGLGAVALTGLGLNHLITRLDRHRNGAA